MRFNENVKKELGRLVASRIGIKKEEFIFYWELGVLGGSTSLSLLKRSGMVKTYLPRLSTEPETLSPADLQKIYL